MSRGQNPRGGNRDFGSDQQREKATHRNNRYRVKSLYAKCENYGVLFMLNLYRLI